MGETPFMHKVMLAVTEIGARVFRNNVGMLKDRHGNRVKYGVCNPGGSDLIGWQSIEVTPEMVGKKVAVFLAIETKAGIYKATDDQRKFLLAVRDAGGIAMLVHEDDEIPTAKLFIQYFNGASK